MEALDITQAKGRESSRAVAPVQQTSKGDKAGTSPQWPPLSFFPFVCQESQRDGKTIQLCPVLFVSGKETTQLVAWVSWQVLVGSPVA